MLIIKYIREIGIGLMNLSINYTEKTKSKRGLSILHNGILNRFKGGSGEHPLIKKMKCVESSGCVSSKRKDKF